MLKHALIYKEIVLKLARASTCPRARVGALLLKNNRIISTGYNGSLPGKHHCEDIGCQEHDGHCIATIHAEMNALLNAAKNGIATEGCELVVTHSPCQLCTKHLIMSGISRVWFITPYRLAENPFINKIITEQL